MWHLLMNLSYFMAANMISDNFGHGCPDVSVNPWSGLTCCGLVTRYGGIDLGQHRTRNGLLPDGTKPLPESKLTQWSLVPFTWKQFHKCSLLDKRWKIANLRLEHSFSQPPVHPCFARAVELIAHPKITQILSFSWGFSSKVAFCTP